jgi:sarcosine oxidase subunit alpha
MSGRLPENKGQIIERNRQLTFSFAGKEIKAYHGDTVATALYAAGVRVMAASFKYHRPRGLMELGVHATDPMMTVDGRYNTRIARTLAVAGMVVEPQFKKGFDIYRLADKASSAMQVGFYYKSPALYKSKKAWNKAREMMRSAPGNLGEIKPLRAKPKIDEVNLNPELMVVGGGLAGLEAALVGAEAGMRVALVEAEPWLGGFEAFQGAEHQSALEELKARIVKYPNITVLLSTTASMLYLDGLAVCIQEGPAAEPFLERSYLIRPKSIVFATGAMDRPLLFQHNDRPGVILPQTAQRLIHLFGVKPADQAVLAGSDDHLYLVALDLIGAGVEVAGLADCRKTVSSELKTVLESKGITVWTNSTVVEAKGKPVVSGAVVAEIGSSKGKAVKCGCIVAGSGITSLFKLAAQGEVRISYDKQLGYHLPAELPLGYAAAGRLLGLADPTAIRASGRLAAAIALRKTGLDLAGKVKMAEEVLSGAKRIINPPQMRAVKAKNRRFICFGNDVTEKDLDQALDEGFNHLEMLKRYTTATMGPEQGALSQANFLDYLAHLQPEAMGDQKINTPRPPMTGVSMAVMAGLHCDIPRITPLHHKQLTLGGRTIRTGPWLRIDHFGDTEGESLALHQTAVLLDVSTLGKFRLFGPDAAKWFNKINTKSIDKLDDKKILYFASVNEEGVVIDDGIAVKLAENDYYFTSSTARSAMVLPWYNNYKQQNWQAWLVGLTEAYASMNLCGPKARDILAELTDSDLSNTALPFMGWVLAEVAGVPVMIFRLGFLGEISFELHCPSSQAEYLWDAIMQAGADHGIRPAGLETQFICRLEKGHILPGLDIDGNTTMFEAHFSWLWDRKKADNVGRPMLRLIENEPHKCRSIGFALDGRAGVIDGHLVVRGDKRLGYVTSTRYSPILDKTIGLALVETDEGLKPGGKVGLWIEGKEIQADYVKTPFYDPDGGRMKS